MIAFLLILILSFRHAVPLDQECCCLNFLLKFLLIFTRPISLALNQIKILIKHQKNIPTFKHIELNGSAFNYLSLQYQFSLKYGVTLFWSTETFYNNKIFVLNIMIFNNNAMLIMLFI